MTQNVIDTGFMSQTVIMLRAFGFSLTFAHDEYAGDSASGPLGVYGPVPRVLVPRAQAYEYADVNRCGDTFLVHFLWVVTRYGDDTKR
jgi:hypothetical protein